MLPEAIKWLWNQAKSVWSKLFVLLAALLLLYAIDTFTSYPSLSLIHDKYETMGAINEILKDPTLTAEQRAQIKKDYVEISERKTYGQLISVFRDRNYSLLRRISNIIHQFQNPTLLGRVANGIIPILSWFIYIICSGGYLYLILLVQAMPNYKVDNPKTSKNMLFVTAFVTSFVMMIMGYIVMLFINPQQHILKYSFFSQLIVVAIFIALGQGLIIRNRLRYRNEYGKWPDSGKKGLK